MRLGCPVDVYADTGNRHETAMLHDYDQNEQAITRHKSALWQVDRAFIDAPSWDQKKKTPGHHHDQPYEKELRFDSTEGSAVANPPDNEGMVKDLRITLRRYQMSPRLHTCEKRLCCKDWRRREEFRLSLLSDSG